MIAFGTRLLDHGGPTGGSRKGSMSLAYPTGETMEPDVIVVVHEPDEPLRDDMAETWNEIILEAAANGTDLADVGDYELGGSD